MDDTNLGEIRIILMLYHSHDEWYESGRASYHPHSVSFTWWMMRIWARLVSPTCCTIHMIHDTNQGEMRIIRMVYLPHDGWYESGRDSYHPHAVASTWYMIRLWARFVSSACCIIHMVDDTKLGEIRIILVLYHSDDGWYEPGRDSYHPHAVSFTWWMIRTWARFVSSSLL